MLDADERATVRVGGGVAGKWKTVDDDNYIGGSFSSQPVGGSTIKRY